MSNGSTALADGAPDVARPTAPDALLRRLEWKVLRRLDGMQHGDHRSAFRGYGIDVVDLRPYEATDEVRHIDWNVTARMDEPYVREFVEDREIDAWLLVDRTPSMTLGPADRTKERVAVELSVALARLLGRSGNRVGAMVLADNGPPTVLRPAGGRRQTLRIAAELLCPTTPAPGATDLGRLLLPAAAALRRRSAVVVVSDFVTVPGWERGLQMLARRHDVSAIEVVDRFERELPDIGVVTVEDAETGAQVEVDTGNAEFRRRHAALVTERVAAVDGIMRRAGVTRSTVATLDDLVPALARLVVAREARR